MKKLFLLTGLNLCTALLFAQKIGIGTTSPAYKLEIAGGSILSMSCRDR